MGNELKHHILVVDDDPAVLRALDRFLTAQGYSVTAASNGAEGLEMFTHGSFDVVLTDIVMPGLDGLGMTEAIHRINEDVPVIILTGQASLQSAEHAIGLRACRYLEKGLAPTELGAVVQSALEMGRKNQSKTAERREEDVKLEKEFESALEKLWLAYQPIVRWSTRTVLSYEALVRSHEPGMSGPGPLLSAAARLRQLRRLSRCIRAAAPATFAGTDALLFVNLVPEDLEDEDLFLPGAPLTRFAPRTVLELMERSSLEGIPELSSRLRKLRQLGFRFAIDDLGCGYSGLNSMALVEPEFVKLDMTLIRDIDSSKAKTEIVRSMLAIGRRLNCVTIAEGVETPAEMQSLLSLGCDYFQGFAFARPGPAFPEVNWSQGGAAPAPLRRLSA